jgi:hypothetical protein
MSLSVFGVFLLMGSDAAVKVRGDCLEAAHRDWIQCFHGEIRGSIDYKQFGGVNVGFPSVGGGLYGPTQVHIKFRKDETSAAAPVLLQTHAQAGTVFDYAKLERYEQYSLAAHELETELRPRDLRRHIPPPDNTRPFVRRYQLFDVTIAQAGQDRDVLEMLLKFERMVESTFPTEVNTAPPSRRTPPRQP